MPSRAQSTERVVFGCFEVNLATGEVFRSGRKLRFSGQPAQVLVILLQRAGQLVSREELRLLLWPDETFVDFDHGLNNCINRIRDVLGDSAAHPRFIETMPKQGYRFIAPAAVPKAADEKASADGAHYSADSSQLAETEEHAIPASSAGAAQAPAALMHQPASRWLMAACAGLLLPAVIAGFYFFGNGRSHPIGGGAYPAFVRAPRAIVTVPGFVRYPALSPDGKQIAFTWRTATHLNDLYVQLIGADQPLQLTHNTRGFICCAAWSPDGQQIAYGHCDDNGGAVFVVPALGGAERKITDVVCLFGDAGWPQWTADGESLVLADRCAPKSPSGIVLFSLLTGEKGCLTSPPAGVESGDSAPTLSPDRKNVAFLRPTTLDHNDLYTIDLAGKNLRRLTHGDYSVGDPLMWTADGRYVIFSSAKLRGPAQVSIEGGPIQPASTFPKVGSLSRDGMRLVYIEGTHSHTTWRLELTSAGGKVVSLKNISISSIFDDSPQLAPDGEHVVVSSWRGGKRDLWRTDIDGKDPVQLTRISDPGWAGSPHWSPDSKWIVMDYRPQDHSQIWMINSEGRDFHAVVADQYENMVPRWSRDGGSIYFTSNRSGEWQIWKLDLASGQKIQITDQGGISVFESYDASTLYYAKRESGGLWRRPLSGGPEVRVTGRLHLGYWGGFAVTENGIYFLDPLAAPHTTIYYYDIQTGRSNPVLPLERITLINGPTLTASRDGRIVVFTQLEATTHINLAEAGP